MHGQGNFQVKFVLLKKKKKKCVELNYDIEHRQGELELSLSILA